MLLPSRTSWRGALRALACAVLFALTACGTSTTFPSPVAAATPPPPATSTMTVAADTPAPTQTPPLPATTGAVTATPDSPTAIPTSTATPAPTAIPTSYRLDVPLYGEQHNLSCEYASAHMLTAYWGMAIDESQFIRDIPFTDNPHRGFRGDIDGYFGKLQNYGIYAEPIARYLDAHGFATKLLDGSAASLRAEIARGRPVIIWLTYALHVSVPTQELIDGLPVTLVPWEHAVVVTGYDESGVFVNGPADGGQAHFGWDEITRSRSYFGGMALTAWPRTKTAPATDTPGISPYFYRTFVNMNGLGFFGAPLTGEMEQDGKIVQYFERARLEYDPKGPDNQPTTFGTLGREIIASHASDAPFQPVPQPADSTATTWFAPTQHTLAGSIRAFWQDNAGAQLFGAPISEAYTEGDKTVQYFERVRLEATADGTVQLGALGRERLAQINTLSQQGAANPK